jgi:hypothetical protein
VDKGPKGFICLCTIATACIVLLLAGGCADRFSCPSESDKVSWTSYAHLGFGQAGSDQTARKCVSSCEWHVYEGHNGGTGATPSLSLTPIG